MSQALLAGDYGAAAQMAQRFRQLAAEHERLRMRERRRLTRDPQQIGSGFEDSSGMAPKFGRQLPSSYESAHENSHWGSDYPPMDLLRGSAAGGSAIDRRFAAPPHGEKKMPVWAHTRLTDDRRPFERDDSFRLAGQIDWERTRGQMPAGASGHVDTRGRRPSASEQGVVQPVLDDAIDESRAAFGRISRVQDEARRRIAREGVNGLGYVPEPHDRTLLARMIFAESAAIPGDFEAVGWSILNRVNRAGYGALLKDVLYQPMQFEPVAQGNLQGVDSDLWIMSANPERLKGPNRASWERALEVADGLLAGVIPDPTGGATHFFASNEYDGTDDTAPKWFRKALREGRITPVPFRSTATEGRRQYFFRDTAPPRRIKRR